MTPTRYLIDNNVLSKLTPKQRASELFRISCRLTSDVLFEARGYVEEELAELEYQVTQEVLAFLLVVMASLEPGKTDLVDLWANKGTADPVLIASLLAIRASESETLFHDIWMLVTDDQTLASTARDFEIPVLSSRDFQSLWQNT